MGTRLHHSAQLNRAARAVIESLEQRRMLAVTLDESSWIIEADDNKPHTIKIDYAPTNHNKLRALIDGKVAGTTAISDIAWIQVYGGGGNDKITIDVDLDSYDLDVEVYAGDGNDTLIGGEGYDDLSGEDGNDSIGGNGGDDILYGDAGDDTIDGGAGADEI